LLDSKYARATSKYFKTQLIVIRVQQDYVDYMIGHAIATYYDIQIKGVEFLRNICAASGLSIRPKIRISKIDALKQVIRVWGLTPEKTLTREACSSPHRTTVNPKEQENTQLKILRQALKDKLTRELQLTRNGKPVSIHPEEVSPCARALLFSKVLRLEAKEIGDLGRFSLRYMQSLGLAFQYVKVYSIQGRHLLSHFRILFFG